MGRLLSPPTVLAHKGWSLDSCESFVTLGLMSSGQLPPFARRHRLLRDAKIIRCLAQQLAPRSIRLPPDVVAAAGSTRTELSYMDRKQVRGSRIVSGSGSQIHGHDNPRYSCGLAAPRYRTRSSTQSTATPARREGLTHITLVVIGSTRLQYISSSCTLRFEGYIRTRTAPRRDVGPSVTLQFRAIRRGLLRSAVCSVATCVCSVPQRCWLLR